MNWLKRTLGGIWIALGPIAIYYLVRTAAGEITKKPGADTLIQWGIFILIALPIVIGLVIFGYYAINGEYDEVKTE